ncbi:MAG: valine--tRNA ligase [Anaerolineae bacterium]|nr:valine--tRNA ligase [Thermoflexales bacterium]MDW8406340.1 valine--tRNA ligase [Anaerolineae bacterium]
MTTQLPKSYDPQAVEERLYRWWEENGYFKPESQLYVRDDEPKFVITIPPPNVTGTLHMGHALTSAIEDLMTRYYRMKGARTLYVPGTDHAGIATQSVVEKNLAKQGRRRQDMTRSEFLSEVWKWKEYSHGVITRQQKKLGISADWSRERFTLDEGLSRAVLTAFNHLYDKGLIYRDTRMVNWDPVQLTSVSDLEVEFEDEGEPGFLWTIRYPLQTNRWDGPQHPWGSGRWAEGATEWITVATTRPETLLGDTAVAVNPEDDRYQYKLGCNAVLPAIGRVIPIIADASVDMQFGTGAVKITPAHDFADYEIGKRHHLPFVEVMDETAHMNEHAGPYRGLDRFECRARIVEDLKKEGLLVKVEDYRVRLGRGQRSGAVIEPRISLQWFCDMKEMAAQAAAAVREGRIRIVPERFERTWFHWLDNIHDWCISRQLWWGHQIPIWYVDPASSGDQSTHDSRRPTQFCAVDEAEAYAQARAVYGPQVKLVQDPDVLDTWFSSGLWPFSVLGWPDDTADMRAYYPTTMLETGYDILFFWVARMVMLGLELTGRPPFEVVYLHGLIRTADGEKMSKSKPDKLVDPLDMIETYGADALRFYLVTAGAPGGDIKVDVKIVDGKKRVERIEGARNFANKLWNAARYVMGRLSGSIGEEETPADAQSSLVNAWIRARAKQVVAETRRLMDSYQYGEAGRLLYEFVWNEFCDWYLELSKLSRSHETLSTLAWTTDLILRLLHPFVPFVTEELWQHLKRSIPASLVGVADLSWPALMLAPYPQADPTHLDSSEVEALRVIPAVQEVIRSIRNARAEHNVDVARRIPALISAGGLSGAFETMRQAIVTLARVDTDGLTIAESLPAPDGQVVTCVLGEATVYLPLSGLIDLEQERKRLAEELAEVEKAVARSEGLLNGDFARRAPAQLVEKERAKLAEAILKRDQIRTRLSQLG